MICVPCSFVSSSFFIICEFLLLFELLENLFIFFNKAMSGFTFFFFFFPFLYCSFILLLPVKKLMLVAVSPAKSESYTLGMLFLFSCYFNILNENICCVDAIKKKKMYLQNKKIKFEPWIA